MQADHDLILLVEEDEDHLILYRTLLEYHGYGVAPAPRRHDVVAFARREQPALILMDVSPPLSDGLEASEVIRLLKREPETREIPVVAVSIATGTVDCAQAFEFGYDGCLPSLTEPSLFLARLEHLVVAFASRSATDRPTDQPTDRPEDAPKT